MPGYLETKLEEDIYLIPVLFEHCQIPEELQKFQWIELHQEDGWTKLMDAIRVGMERRKLADRIVRNNK